MNILNLPTEILIGVCYYLEPNETISLSLVNNASYLLIHNNPIIWRFYCHKYGFVQFKSDGIWCHNKYELIRSGNKIEYKINNYVEKNQLRIKRSFIPKEEVKAYRIEFGNDDKFLKILEYDWWKKDDKINSNANYNSNGNCKTNIDFVQNISKGKKLLYKWSDNVTKDTNIDISFATELVNWRLVFYMNILNENGNHTFWLRVGDSIDIMTPITTVKIDPKIYKDMDESISVKVCELAKKIKYLSTLHTCRHFIRLPCPMRIREILIGGRIGNIITSEPNSQGRYLLELPIELIHCTDENDDLLDYNCNSVNNGANNNEDFALNKNKLQLPINIFRSKKSLDDGCLNDLFYEKKKGNIINNLNPIDISKSGSECREKERRINLKLNYNLYKKISLTNAFISFASNTNWKTSLTPRSVSVFKQLNSADSINNNYKDKDLFVELLMSAQKKRVNNETGNNELYLTNIYSSNYRTHSPINCTTPCSVINRTCNIEFHNIKEYFDMLCSNSIIFNMFATSINLQYSNFESEQNEYCWCEYPKSLIGCIWKYNPVKSNINEIKSMLLNSVNNFDGNLSTNTNINKVSNTNDCYIGSKELLEIMIKVKDISSNEMWRKYFNTNRLLSNNKTFITLKRDNSCLIDLICCVISHISNYYKEHNFYPVVILQGLGWITQFNKDKNKFKEEEVIKKIFGVMKNSKDYNFIKLIRNNIQELISSLNEDYSFVNGELIHTIIKDYSIDNISYELKDQVKAIGDLVIPISWTLDGKNLYKVSILPYTEKTIFNQENGVDNQNLSSFLTLSSFEDVDLMPKQKFIKCKVITIKRELNRFDDDISDQKIIDEIKKFKIKDILNLINEMFGNYNQNVNSNSNSNSRLLNHNNYQVSHINTLFVDNTSMSVENSEDENELCKLNMFIENENNISPKNGNNTNNTNKLKLKKEYEYLKYSNYVKVAILNSSEDTRQFEFSSKRSDLVLIGTSFGKVRLVDRYKDKIVGEEGVSISPIIGLSWLNNHPELFIAGSCLLGSISILSMKENPFYMEELLNSDNNSEISSNYINNIYYDSHNYHYDNNNKTSNINKKYPYIIKIEKQTKAFPQLSSISVNSTDDYFLTSGFGKSVALYNVYSGSFMKLMPDMHMSHINIVRFTNYHPHVFSTVSFDSTCKIWDLRQKIQGNDPVIKFELPCMAIMSCFTPKDDLKIVVSGIDDYMKQLDLRSKVICKNDFNIPSLGDDHSFRRSLYNSNGDIIYTINTKDKYIRGYSSLDSNLSFNFNIGRFSDYFSTEKTKHLDNNGVNISTNYSNIELIGSKIHIFKENNSNSESINNEITSISSFNNRVRINEQDNIDMNIQNDINLQSIRGHPIFDDICGILVTGSEETVFSKSKIALIKFNNDEISNIY
ncbi:hypothetical protein RS030_111875 [Cryptosporidium xiaoi]|uniref:F-box domain-containing protein n=1 Tax=Cryptosporidium xiaoi TaxID=659607 RepID=A0AAV9Y223_9CRYT